MNKSKKKNDLPFIVNKALESNYKSFGEWVYGTLNKNRSSRNIIFKQPKAYEGYEGKKLNLCKKFIFLIKKL